MAEFGELTALTISSHLQGWLKTPHPSYPQATDAALDFRLKVPLSIDEDMKFQNLGQNGFRKISGCIFFEKNPGPHFAFQPVSIGTKQSSRRVFMHTRTKLKAIVVGSHGQQGREHIKILSDLVDLRAFVDTRADIEQISDVSQFTLLERALEREKRDVVIVSLPHYLHYQATHALMTAGVHVIKDKPLAMCADELVSYRNLVRSTHKLYLRSCSVDEDRRFAWRPRVSINWV